MPQVKDAPMVLVGHVANVEAKLSYNADPTAPRTADGLRILVSAADGFAIVNVKQADVAIRPELGERVAWVVRPMFWEMDSGSGMSVRFVRKVDHADIDFIGSAMPGALRTESVAG